MERSSAFSTKIDYEVKLENFQGPFDLLLHLLEENKMDIHELSLAALTDQYLHYLHEMEKKELNVSAQFLYVAAILIEFKSKSLLPKSPDEDEFSLTEEDEKQQLLERLVQYKIYKQAAQELIKQKSEGIYTRTQLGIDANPLRDKYAFIKLKPATTTDLAIAFKKIYDRVKLREQIDDAIIDISIVSVEEKMNHIKNKIQKKKAIELDDLFNKDTTTADVIVTFLALLELTKLTIITLTQDELFGKIVIINAHEKTS
ncbi:segregation and condensation protein A [Candidatus Margulisiibacteriota bacterium]